LNIKAIVFDRDGTIFNSSNSLRCLYEDLKVALLEKGSARLPTFEEFMSGINNSPKFFWTISKGLVRKRDFWSWRGLYHYKNKNENFSYAEIYPEVSDALRGLSRCGLELILTSGWFGSEATRKALAKRNLDRYFKEIITLDDLIAKKYSEPPQYDLRRLPFRRSTTKKKWLLTQALKTLNSRPEQTVFVGDSNEDIMAGKSLGTKTVALLTGEGAKHIIAFKQAKPDAILKNLGTIVEKIASF
jgi:phosphoglycolate phosphatase-like HAD superfamily hydrolase